MLQTLEIRGYRGFEAYRLADLARVNLVVGKNNCGKTSVLEAVELLVSRGHPGVFYDSSLRRGEVGVSQDRQRRGRWTDISHVFFGHTTDLGTRFDLSADVGEYSLAVNLISLAEYDEYVDSWNPRRRAIVQKELFDQYDDVVPMLGLNVDGGVTGTQAVFPIMDDGTVLLDRFSRSVRGGSHGYPVRFVTLESLDLASMGSMWDTVLAKGNEEAIVDDMRILEPRLDSLHFLTSSKMGSGILVGLHTGGRRLPIGTYGDGMRRLLALRLSFVGSANGFLLIDEIDTGLHWTVMEDMWSLVVGVARKSNVQVFATTHSYDCIQGLGALLQSQPDLADQVSVQKVDTSLKQAVCLRGDQINVAVEQEIEVR